MTGRHRIGVYVADFEARQLLLNGQPVDLHWRAFEALAALADAGGKVVDRNRLFQILWPDTQVDESNLGKLMSQLRRTLSERDPANSYVETLPRLGYRLSVAVTPVVEIPMDEPPALPPPPIPARRWTLASPLVVAVTLGAVGALGWGAWLANGPRRDAANAVEQAESILRVPGTARTQEAIALLRRATELDPNSATAFSVLAQALNRNGGWLPGASAVEHPALTAAREAVRLDPHCAPCLATYGLFQLMYEWNWPGAQSSLDEAVRWSRNPVDVGPTRALSLMVTGRLEEALREVDSALAARPFQAGLHQMRGRCLYLMRRYDESIEASDRALAIQNNERGAAEFRSHAFFAKGDLQSGLRALAPLNLPGGPSPGVAAADFRSALQSLLEGARGNPSHSWRRVRWSLLLGDSAGALREMEEACKARHFEAMFIAVDPLLEPLRANAGYRSLLETVNLAPHSSAHR